MSTDPVPGTEGNAVRAAMVGLARLWEDTATDLAEAIEEGASRATVEVDTLRQCAAEMRTTLRSPRLGVIDPVWGRDEYLWSVLDAAVDPSGVTA